ncbi:MAG TPA: flagellar protein FlgN [Chromatiaceae bacterium]|jgi:flagellar biosynthesis/type III secretory pathway chaperone|nr:flagellar protein FlgN [Chromatiaceae bacterium]HIN82711.1 flagellar protein FlgN [Chromatiales bacterium]HIO53771.1 flagellar protein FlgN [Chromatiales bacterium]
MNQQKTHLIPLLQQELEVGQRLLDALNNEFHCLQQRDPKAIEQAVASKQICVAEFEGIDHQRQQLASQGDIPAQSPTHAPQTDDPQLKKLLQKLQTLATECHQQNLVNGGITELGRQHNQRCLNILLGQGDQVSLYDQAGEKQSRTVAQQLAIA